MPPSTSETHGPPIASLIRTEARSEHAVGGSVDTMRTKQHCKTPWLSLNTLAYRFPHDAANTYARHWDVVKRTTRQSAMSADAVVVFARVRGVDAVPRVLLVKQFRPPVNAVTVELPAGLVDEGETATTAALRELREETGFVARVDKVHAPAPLSPGMAEETVVLVEVTVEGSAAKPLRLDESENIEVVSVPVARLAEALEYMVDAEGVCVMHGLSTLALGFQVGRSLSVEE